MGLHGDLRIVPKFVAEDGNVAPLESGTFDFTNATMSVPSGQSLADVELRNIDASLSTLEYRVQFVPSSGLFTIASGTAFVTMDFSDIPSPPDSGLYPLEIANSAVEFYGNGDSMNVDSASGMTGWDDLGPQSQHLTSGGLGGTSPFIENGTAPGNFHERLAWFTGETVMTIPAAICQAFGNGNDNPWTQSFVLKLYQNPSGDFCAPISFRENTGDPGGMFTRWVKTDGDWFIWKRDSVGAGTVVQVDSGNMAEGEWHVVTWSTNAAGTTLGMWIDGNAIYTAEAWDVGTPNTNTGYVGDWVNGGNGFVGYMAEIYLAQSGLTDEERVNLIKNQCYRFGVAYNG